MNIAIDVDGVVRNFADTLTEVYLEEYPLHRDLVKPITEWELEKFFPIGKHIYNFAFKQKAEEIFLLKAKSYPYVYTALLNLTIAGHKITFLTIQTKKTGKYTESWLELNFPFQHYFKWDLITLVSRSKDKKSNYDFDLYIDDSPDNLQDLYKAKKHIVCMSRPWNSKLDLPIKRVNNLFEFGKYMEKIQ